MKYNASGTSGTRNGIIYWIVYWVAIIVDSVYVKTSADDGVDLVKDIYNSIFISLFKLAWDWKMFIKEKIQFGKWINAVDVWVITWINT